LVERADVRARVLAVVDDDDSVRDAIKFLLEMADYTVRAYESPLRMPDNAWRDLDCLVVDQHMPGITGLEVLARMRADSVHLPVVLITGSTSPDLERRAAELGARVLVKPLVEDDLLAVIRAAIGEAL
jgi:two-component system, LuxR family, response regulator FixJ